MEIKATFSDEDISRILDQALVYQCACPAQICKSIIGLRELYDYQNKCINRDETDQRVHNTIAKSTEAAHEEMEKCLKDVLYIEGWDLENLTMPEDLKKVQKDLI